MMLRGTQINYMPDKSHVIIIIINTQGQIIQTMLLAANSIHSPHFAVWLAKRSVSEMPARLQIPFTARTLPFGSRKGAFQRWQFVIWPRVVIIMPLNYKLPVSTTFFHKQQCTSILIFFPLHMGLLLTNARRIESSSVRLHTSLRSWPLFWCVFHKRKPMGERVTIRFLHSSRAFSRLPPLEGVSNTHWAEKTTKKTASYPGYLYSSGGTPPHGLLVPIRLLWLQLVPAKKSRTLCYEKAL